jgi:GTPase SAR1 family protein
LAPLQDTAGQEQFARLTSFYARDAAAAVLAYDLTDRQSFEDIPKWYNYVIESRRNNKEQADCVVILAGAPQSGRESRSKRNIPRNSPATRFFFSFSSPLQHANRT